MMCAHDQKCASIQDTFSLTALNTNQAWAKQAGAELEREMKHSEICSVTKWAREQETECDNAVSRESIDLYWRRNTG